MTFRGPTFGTLLDPITVPFNTLHFSLMLIRFSLTLDDVAVGKADPFRYNNYTLSFRFKTVLYCHF